MESRLEKEREGRRDKRWRRWRKEKRREGGEGKEGGEMEEGRENLLFGDPDSTLQPAGEHSLPPSPSKDLCL